MTSTTQSEQHYFRRLGQQAIERLSSKQKTVYSKKIAETVLHLPCFYTAKTICLYESLPDEVDTTQLVETLRQHHRIVIPRIEEKTLLFIEIDRQTTYKRNIYGIREPNEGALIPLQTIDTWIIPGKAFDPHGTRIGRGKGYYDTVLAHSSALLIGLAFSVQIFPLLPKKSCDIVMNIIVTEEEIYSYENTRTTS
jgi:5-formyltetrahydrofolate cyclo-ligase